MTVLYCLLFALFLVLVNGFDSNNASCMRGGQGDPLSRYDYQLNNVELRLRAEQASALGNILTSIKDLSSNIKDLRNEMDKMGSDIKDLDGNIKDLDTKLTMNSKDLETKLTMNMKDLDTKLTMNNMIFFALFIVFLTQLPFLQQFTSVVLKSLIK